MARSVTDTLEFAHSGYRVPQLGFGAFATTDCTRSVLNALKAGYRHIDTAQSYLNEEQVGKAVQLSGIPREDIFITTKFFVKDESKSQEEVYATALESVNKCDPRRDGYVDLFIIHHSWIGTYNRKLCWRTLERLLDEGKVRSIGVSNWGPPHLEELRQYAKYWPPAVNQIELHPWSQQHEVVQYCNQHGILLEAYCPLVRNQRASDPTVAAMAKELGIVPNQILLRWSLERGWIPLPKSDDPDRVKLNADLYSFDLTERHIKILNDLDQGQTGSCRPENLPDNFYGPEYFASQ